MRTQSLLGARDLVCMFGNSIQVPAEHHSTHGMLIDFALSQASLHSYEGGAGVSREPWGRFEETCSLSSFMEVHWSFTLV